MNYKIVVTPEAFNEIQEAYVYYKNVAGQKVARSFSSKLKSSFKSLKKNPFYEFKIKDYRSFPVNKFPYIIIFQIDETQKYIRILSIFNSSQDPNKYPS
jgi:toxin ParE1/3/4